MTTEALPQNKDELMTRIQGSRAKLEAVLGALNEKDMTTPGPEGWSVKDHLAHLVTWESVLLVHHIGNHPFSEVQGMDAESAAATANMNSETGLNDFFYERNKDRALTDIRADMQQSYQQVLATLDDMSYTDLQKIAHPDEDDSATLLKEVVDNTYEHYDEHTRTIRAVVAYNKSVADEAVKPTKEELLKRITNSYTALDEAIAGLSEAQMLKPDAGGWSIKDNMAHLLTWQNILLRYHLGGAPWHEAVGLDAATAEALDEDGYNAIFFKRNKDRSLADIQADLKQTEQKVLTTLDGMTWAQITRPLRPDSENPDPLLAWIGGNTFGHYEEHVATIKANAAS